MKFKVGMSDVSGSWFESYDDATVTDEATAIDFIARVVNYYNSTLRPKERARAFTGYVELLGEGKGAEHDWHKQNLVTQSDHRGMFDNMKCSACGVTARRYGFGSYKRSPKFSAKKYATCTGKPI